MKKLFLIIFSLLLASALSAYQDQMRTLEQITADLKKNPNDTGLFVELADYYKSAKDMKNARLNYEKALNLDKKNPEACYEMSQILRKEQEYEKALAYAKTASEMKPLRSRYKSGIGLILYKMNRLDEAEKYFKESLNQSTKKSDFDYSMLGYIYLKQDKFKEAVEAFNKQQELKPWDKSGYVNLARVYYKMKDKEKGDYYKGLAGDEWDQYKGKDGAGDTGEGKKKFEKDKGWDLYRAKDYNNAVKTFQEGMKKDPDDLENYIGLGYAYGKLNKTKEALNVFEQAIKKDPSSAR
ncbi:MAG: tetratricopeptide repeat protein, partial [bacterium]|nr:tetratricopeptide repeat protein [bacterium]